MNITEFAKNMTVDTSPHDILLACGQAKEVADGGALTLLYAALGGDVNALAHAVVALRTDHPEVQAWSVANRDLCLDPETRVPHQLAAFDRALEWAEDRPESVRRDLDRQAQNLRSDENG